jgi:hypothetical protein
MRPRAGLGTAKEGKIEISFPAENEISNFCTEEPVFWPRNYIILANMSFCTGMYY